MGIDYYAMTVIGVLLTKDEMGILSSVNRHDWMDDVIHAGYDGYWDGLVGIVIADSDGGFDPVEEPYDILMDKARKVVENFSETYGMELDISRIAMCSGLRVS